MVEAQNERQPDRHFRRSHRQNEQEHDLAISLAPTRTAGDERQARSIQHHLNRHQDKKQVTPHQKTDQPQCEQDPCQKQPVLDRNC